MKPRSKLLAAVASAAGMAAGYYFFAAKDAKRNRKLATKWADDLKADVMKRAQKLKTVDRASFAGIIDSASKAYKGARNLSQKDLMHAADELKENWQKLHAELKQKGVFAQREATKTMGAATRTIRKTAKKVSARVKKVVTNK